MIPVTIPGINDKLYAGFWSRLAAGFIDGLVWAPVLYGFEYIEGLNMYNFLYTHIIGILIAIFYDVYLVKKYGGTLGKLAMGIKIIRTDGFEVDWKESFNRYLVSFIISISAIVLYFSAASHISDEQFYAADIWNRKDLMVKQAPMLNYWMFIYYAWFVSEFIVLLTNPRKRAIHDFIADTVVIKSKYHNHIKEYQMENDNASQ